MFLLIHTKIAIAFAICRSEIKSLKKIAHLFSYWETVTLHGRHLCVFAVVILMYLTGHPPRPSVIYIVIGIYNNIRLIIMRFMLSGVRSAIAATVSMNRVKVSGPC